MLYVISLSKTVSLYVFVVELDHFGVKRCKNYRIRGSKTLTNFSCSCHSVIKVCKFVGLLKDLANIATQVLSYLIPKNPCQPLVTTLHPHLIQNSIFTCDKHKDKICKVIIQLVMKPILNICL
jgi:hypothetical protein